MSDDPTAQQSEALPGPPAGLEENTEMEFQVAPMVDVLLVLLLFFMATATTEVITQTADLDLPKANESKAVEKGANTDLVINVEKINFLITIKAFKNDGGFDDPKDIMPQLRSWEQASVRDGKPVRVVVRADKDTPFERISGIMKACAEAGILDVVFMADDEHVGDEEAKAAARNQQGD
ncbi:MAG: biopolymer transporter ExbD [Verrucomicrobiales bacterium]|jgi:biopolymer transport protein ExbD|nr:biopolymer transporter ExbD [Verrucomicrobiales bacterium]